MKPPVSFVSRTFSFSPVYGYALDVPLVALRFRTSRLSLGLPDAHPGAPQPYGWCPAPDRHPTPANSSASRMYSMVSVISRVVSPNGSHKPE